jgi:hypothetical protein
MVALAETESAAGADLFRYRTLRMKDIVGRT